MTTWIRYQYQGKTGFGTLAGDRIEAYEGNLFERPTATGQSLQRQQVNLLAPCQPGKMLGLWNNFHQRAAKEGLTRPEHPLYFIKVNSCFNAAEQPIRQPSSYSGPVVFEGELGIVIGKTCHDISPEQSDDYIFGYTCVNDVTARGILKADPSFPQWTRAKGFDTFGVFGPAIVTDIEPDDLVVTTMVDGQQKQHYPVRDMFFRPREIVSELSQDMTLNPGDLIACGTSIGVEPMTAGCNVQVAIEGVGVLSNSFVAA
ncbi:MAG: fumarylacetoacetate hydrolase family protein [Gammaproteobacteria bacterium]|nr:fumarylacetoacetate hydrolase family protein [Gammaproteobacteria bacterium]